MKFIPFQFLLICIVINVISCNGDKGATDTVNVEGEISKGEIAENNSGTKAVNASPSNIIFIDNLDQNLLSDLIIELVNEERSSKGLKSLEPHPILQSTAIDHNNFMASSGILTHEGNRESTKDLRSRVSVKGGKFQILAENIAMMSFGLTSTKSINETYAEVANQFFNMWKDSPGHYKNMVIKELIYIGIAVRWSDLENAIYATQVFGG